MATEVNAIQLQATAAASSSALLKGILKLLCDIHCKDMTPDERSAYMKDLNKDMEDYRKAILQSSKV